MKKPLSNFAAEAAQLKGAVLSRIIRVFHSEHQLKTHTVTRLSQMNYQTNHAQYRQRTYPPRGNQGEGCE